MTRTSSWITCIIIWRARVFQNGDFFLHYQEAAMSLRHVRIVSLLNGSFFRVHLTSPLNIWRARINFFFSRFQPFRTATPTMQTGRLTYLQYQRHVGHIHYQYLTRSSIFMWLFFFTFLKTCRRFPHRWKDVHYITFFSFYHLIFKIQ
jgi:hypothetical protein